MDSLVIYPTETAQWHALVNEAEAFCALKLGEELEHYLVYLLMRFSSQPSLMEGMLAIEFLESLNLSGQSRETALRNLGDKCLLFSGLFPKRAERLSLNLGYFVNLGQVAYSILSNHSKEDFARLFSMLSQSFVKMMDVLQATREVSASQETSLLSTIELWQETGSSRAHTMIANAANEALMPLETYLKLSKPN